MKSIKKIIRSTLFLRAFSEEITQKIEKDNQIHIKYVPTQVVTEYLKQELKIDGIIYTSAQNEGGKNCVLFFDNTQMFNESDENKKGLILEKVKPKK